MTALSRITLRLIPRKDYVVARSPRAVKLTTTPGARINIPAPRAKPCVNRN